MIVDRRSLSVCRHRGIKKEERNYRTYKCVTQQKLKRIPQPATQISGNRFFNRFDEQLPLQAYDRIST